MIRWIRDGFYGLAEACTALIVVAPEIVGGWWLKLRARIGTRLLCAGLRILPRTKFRAVMIETINHYLDELEKGVG